MKIFQGKIAVVTGAGTGIGRELARQLASDGCNLAICDINLENMSDTKIACEELAPPDTLITMHECDVSDESQVVAFREAVKNEHNTEFINLLFNNAGIGGAGSFLLDDRADWDKTFGVCWSGVYYCTRAFIPMLVASPEGHIINISSINGIWACLGPNVPHTAYSTAKFAVKGFSEGLYIDLRMNAPHIKVSVVMPGHIGTSIAINSPKILGKPSPADMTETDIAESRRRMENQGIPTEGISDDQIRELIRLQMEGFRDNAPVSPAEAATIILNGVRSDRWRIIVGEDAEALDQMVRESPEIAYEQSFMAQLLEKGHFDSTGIMGDIEALFKPDSEA
jgi:NAD(P)-dependent dehydrogenase (short-subunit alcohol dehydrogenase family)